MRKITSIRIPKGKQCKECIFCDDVMLSCWLSHTQLFVGDALEAYHDCERNEYCLKKYPNGAVFELKEKK